MEVIVERPAALDVHKAQVTACVRVPASGGREQHIAEFPTTVRGLLALRDWLAAEGVQQVVMEATGVYWKAPWAILEDEFECLLVNARHVKQVPGRKTDVSDAAWLCQLAEAGVLSDVLCEVGVTDAALGAGKGHRDQAEDQDQGGWIVSSRSAREFR